LTLIEKSNYSRHPLDAAIGFAPYTAKTPGLIWSAFGEKIERELLWEDPAAAHKKKT